MSNQEYCIPRVKNGFSNKYIENTFEKLQIGVIEKVICLPLKYDNNYKRVIIKVNIQDVVKIDTLSYITNEINVVFSLKCLNNIARTIITIIIHWGLNKGDNPKNIKLNIIFSFKKKYEPIRIKK